MDEEADGRAGCALEGCENLLPPPARDERGRLKGGKPVRYCSKAHADEASRRRRALEAVGAEEPLQLLRNLGGETREVMDAALTQFAEIRRRWDELDAGAVAQSAKDRVDTAEAMLKVERAERVADDAERAKAEAVAAAAKDQQLRMAAEQAAEAAVQEAEQVRKTAWEQTAEHERARGQAETRALLAEQGQRDALDMLESVKRELRDLKILQQDTLQRMTDALAAAERADAARELAEAKIAGAEEKARLAGEAAQRAQQETEAARRAERQAWSAAEAGAQRAQQDVEAARRSETQARSAAENTLSTLSQAQEALLQRISDQGKEIADLRARLAAQEEVILRSGDTGDQRHGDETQAGPSDT
jgi:hypothetical protein